MSFRSEAVDSRFTPFNYKIGMGYYILFLSLLLPLVIANTATGQTVNFSDGFEDGDFTQNPTWTGDDSLFTITTIKGNNLLQLAGNDEENPAYLSTPSKQITGSWELFFKYNASSPPSGSNKAIIFLMSDRANLKGAVNGYAIQIGKSGDDVFELVRYDAGSPTVILSDTTIIQNNESGYRVKVSRSSAGEWRIEVGEGYYGRLYSSGQTITDSAYISASYFGVLVEYTSTRANNFFFDFKIDIPPFAITNVVPADKRSIDVSFNRAYDPSTVSSGDFSLNHGLGKPSSFETTAANTIRLHYPGDLPSEKYVLSANGINDLSGNQLQHATETFIVFGTFVKGDVKINEFMYDPPARLEEYVEIINTSEKYLNLAGWKISDDSNSESLNSNPIVLSPNGFLVISSDTAKLDEKFGSRPYLEVNLPSFNNGGDAIRLVTADGATADSLSYTPNWGGENVALERRSLSTTSTFKENWGESPTGTGTPGRANEVTVDQEPPAFTRLFTVNASVLRLTFSEPVTASTATDISNFTITPPRAIQLISAQKDSVTLFLNEALVSGQTYKVTVSNIADIFGNVLASSSRKVKYLKIEKARAGDIVINEFLYDGGAEFVEIYNTTDKNFDLSGWYIGDSSNKISIGENVQLLAHNYLILTESSAFARAHNNAIVLSDFPALNNNGDSIYLQNASEITVDSLHYSPIWGIASGISLERKDPLAASNDASNWKQNLSQKGNSAGAKNDSFEPDTYPPKAVFAKTLSSGQIEVQFNEFIQLTADVEFLANGHPLSVASFDSANANIITLENPPAKANAQATKIIVHDLSDVKGNRTAESEIAIAQPLGPSDLVINEIMFNPLNDSDDNKADQSEYIELRNTRNHAISLEGIILHDAPDEDGNLRTIQPVTTTAKWVPPKGVVLIYADEIPVFKRSKIANFFDLKVPRKQSIIRVDRASLSLASTGDAIFIADSTGTTIDSVFYDESWHNPNLIDNTGIALERISPKGSSNDKSNWSSSVHPKGGTPNAENSIYQPNAEPARNVGISFSPNPFSPDGDGYEDNLFINYKLDQPDYLLKVQIYDRYGRFITELADGKQAGFEGTLIWDGRKSDGSRNHIGIYIVVFEAYNSTTGENKAFKKIVVLARRLN